MTPPRTKGLDEATVVAAAARIADAVGKAREDSIRAVAVAFRGYAIEHPGRYAATVRAPADDDREGQEVVRQTLAPLISVLGGWGIEGDEAIHLVRVVRSALHGFVSLELGGGFGMSLHVDESFEVLVDSLVVAIEAQAVKAS
jgi:hypothetical protein